MEDCAVPKKRLQLLVQVEVEHDVGYEPRAVDVIEDMLASCPLGIRNMRLLKVVRVLGDAGVREGGYAPPCRGRHIADPVPVARDRVIPADCRCGGVGYRSVPMPGHCEMDADVLRDPLGDLVFVEKCDRCEQFDSDFEAAHTWFTEVKEVMCGMGNAHAVVRTSTIRPERLQLWEDPKEP